MKPAVVATHPSLGICLRLIAAIPGGYALTAATVAALGGVLPLIGMTRSDAVALSAMLGFLLYLILLLWAFAQRSLARLWGVFAGGLAICGALLWIMSITVWMKA